mmetsp:Transcript_10817/g.23274  ORF Transcript_10817/g.23274 Transcript_10817/m.23274 type:complete len:217 (-) Transcript_10817:585-1235(-)
MITPQAPTDVMHRLEPLVLELHCSSQSCTARADQLPHLHPLVCRNALVRQRLLLHQLISSCLHLGSAGGVNAQALHDGPLALLAGDRVAVHQAHWHAVAAVRHHAHADPAAVSGGAQHPVTDVVAGAAGGRQGAGQTAGLDDCSAPLLHRGDELAVQPGVVANHVADGLAADSAVVDVGVLGGGVVAPDGHVAHSAGVHANALGDLGQRPVVVEAC